MNVHQRWPVKFYTEVALSIVYAKREKEEKNVSKKENPS